jgi:hypothetical protein
VFKNAAALGSLCCVLTLSSGAAASPPSGLVTPQDRMVMGDDVRIAANERVKNLEVLGGDVVVKGEITEDVRVLGGDVTLAGPVGGDVELLGGDMKIESSVRGTVQMIGGDLDIAGVVHGDVLIRGGDLHMKPGGKVEGQIKRDAGGRPEFFAKLSTLPPWLRRVVPGVISYETAIFSVFKIIVWFGVFMLVLPLIWLDRSRFGRWSQVLAREPFQAFGWGMVALFLGFMGMTLLIVTLIGIPLAGLLGVLIGALFYAGLGLSAAALGRVLPFAWLSGQPVLQFMIGCMLLAGLSALPWLGSLIMFFASLAGVGAVIANYRRPPQASASDTPMPSTSLAVL